MRIERMNKLMNILLGILSFVIFTGALLKLWHYPVGSSILWLGVVLYSILSSMEISRLKKIIAKSKRVVNADELTF